MYDTMVAMGYTGTSDFNGPVKLPGDVKGASVLILGAGLAGMTAAYELRKAGYKVQVLEYNARPGGRNWSLYGGDNYTDIGGVTQNVKFAPGLYFNPGPWRLPRPAWRWRVGINEGDTTHRLLDQRLAALEEQPRVLAKACVPLGAGAPLGR